MSIDRVIDSFLVREGSAVRVDAHRERFVHAVDQVFGAAAARVVPGFWEQSLAQIPAQGLWFPRFAATRVSAAQVGAVQAGAQGLVAVFGHNVCFECAIRLAPRLRETTTLLVVEDRRSFPHLKGADGAVCAADRERAIAAGADDALYARAGEVIEAAHGALLAWRGNTLLLTPPVGRLASTTVAWIADTAPAMGVNVQIATWGLSEVDELWYVNALHGLTHVAKVVTPVVGARTPGEPPAAETLRAVFDGAVDHERLRTWREKYLQAYEPMRVISGKEVQSC